MATSVGGQVSVFQTLKPTCVALNDAIVRFQRSGDGVERILTALQKLHDFLESQASNPTSLDSRLCDYVFFPVSQVFRERSRLPINHLTLAVQCLRVLLRTGWRKITDPEVAVQLLILLTFLSDGFGKPPETVKLRTSEDLVRAALQCMHDLFVSIAASSTCTEKLLETSNVPAVGHGVSVLLDNVKQKDSNSVVLAASKTLNTFVTRIADPDVLQSFLPGIVSAVSGVVTVGSTSRPPFRVLESLLQVLSYIVKNVLADVRIASLSKNAQSKTNPAQSKWLESTSSQMKLALAHVVRLSKHSRAEVREQLASLCWTVMVDCQLSLQSSSELMFETLASLALQEGGRDSLWSLDNLFTVQPSIMEEARSVLYNWIISLPRIMAANDEDLRSSHLHKISLVYGLLVENGVEMSLLNDVLTTNLMEGLVSATQNTNVFSSTRPELIPQSESDDSFSHVDPRKRLEFPNALTHRDRSVGMLTDVQSLIQKMASSKNNISIMRKLLDASQSAQGQAQVLNFWLSLSLARASNSGTKDLEDFIDFGPLQSVQEPDSLQELYETALSILSQSDELSEGNDWRIQALALEAIAFEAQHLKREFRNELVEALYPVIHLIGSPIGPLRDHAMISLNIIAQACEYSSAQDLVIQNVDYLVNSISLKLSTFDLSPQAPQVLLMLTKLCGPKLLPYLDDLIDNVFEALDCFHGYPKLVELLFSLLNGIVEEGAKAPDLAIESGGLANSNSEVNHQKQPYTSMSVSEAIHRAKTRREKTGLVEEIPEVSNNPPEATPLKPWKELQNQSTSDNEDLEDNPNEDLITNSFSEQTGTAEPTETKPTKSTLLLQRVADLTKHHLPTPAPTTRTLILSLLSKAIPALSRSKRNEDVFLPLVHTLWPVLVSRLNDNEMYVKIGVLDVIGLICIGAGDFVSTRAEGFWNVIRKIWKDVQNPNRPGGSIGGTTGVIDDETTGSNRIPKRAAGPISLLVNDSTSIITSPNRSLIVKSHGDAESKSEESYTPLMQKRLKETLTTFLLRLTTHVTLPVQILREIQSEMLWYDIVVLKRQDVIEALERVDPEGIWLLRERGNWTGGNDNEDARGVGVDGRSKLYGSDRLTWWIDRRPLPLERRNRSDEEKMEIINFAEVTVV